MVIMQLHLLILLVVTCRARLGLKDGAWARPMGAPASPTFKPGPMLRLKAGLGLARLSRGSESQSYVSKKCVFMLINQDLPT